MFDTFFKQKENTIAQLYELCNVSEKYLKEISLNPNLNNRCENIKKVKVQLVK